MVRCRFCITICYLDVDKSEKKGDQFNVQLVHRTLNTPCITSFNSMANLGLLLESGINHFFYSISDG